MTYDLFLDFNVSMSDPTLTVDEDVEDNTEYICVDLYIENGGIVECELEVTLSPYPGTAGRLFVQTVDHKFIIVCGLTSEMIYILFCFRFSSWKRRLCSRLL